MGQRCRTCRAGRGLLPKPNRSRWVLLERQLVPLERQVTMPHFLAVMLRPLGTMGLTLVLGTALLMGYL